MKKLLYVMPLIPLACFSERPPECYQGELTFTPRGSSERTYYGKISNKSEYLTDLEWNSTTWVEIFNDTGTMQNIVYDFPTDAYLIGTIHGTLYPKENDGEF